jgi:mRNA interferase YafQ
MLKLRLAASYKKDLRLAESQGRDLKLLRLPLSLLLNRWSLPPRYRDHPLKGRWRGHRELHIQPNWILIYRIEDDERLVLVRIGTHSELFDI